MRPVYVVKKTMADGRSAALCGVGSRCRGFDSSFDFEVTSLRSLGEVDEFDERDEFDEFDEFDERGGVAIWAILTIGGIR